MDEAKRDKYDERVLMGWRRQAAYLTTPNDPEVAVRLIDKRDEEIARLLHGEARLREENEALRRRLELWEPRPDVLKSVSLASPTTSVREGEGLVAANLAALDSLELGDTIKGDGFEYEVNAWAMPEGDVTLLLARHDRSRAATIPYLMPLLRAAVYSPRFEIVKANNVAAGAQGVEGK